MKNRNMNIFYLKYVCSQLCKIYFQYQQNPLFEKLHTKPYSLSLTLNKGKRSKYQRIYSTGDFCCEEHESFSTNKDLTLSTSERAPQPGLGMNEKERNSHQYLVPAGKQMKTPLKTRTSQSSVEKHPRDNDPFSLFQRSVHRILESISLNGLAF